MAQRVQGSVKSTDIVLISSVDLNSSDVTGSLPLSKIATIANQTILGNNSGSTGVPTALSTGTVSTMLGVPSTQPGTDGAIAIWNAGGVISNWDDEGKTDGIVISSSGAALSRSISGTTNRITVTNGDGVPGNPTIDVGSLVVRTDAAFTYTAGAKQSVSHSGTTAGFRVVGASGDPSSPVDGDVWYNSSTNKFRGRENGASKDLSGDVVGPASSTDNTLPRFDSTTGKLLQTSAVVVDDSNNMSGVGTLASSRTNGLLRSQEFDNSGVWGVDSSGTGSNPTVTANYSAAPDGTTTAERLQLNKGGGTGFSRIAQSGASAAAPYVFSVWMRTNDQSTVTVGLRLVATGTVVSVGPTWRRFWITGTASAGASACEILLWNTLSTSDTADLSVWGAQLEPGTIPTAYTVTTSSTAATTGEAFAAGELYGDVQTVNGKAAISLADGTAIAAGDMIYRAPGGWRKIPEGAAGQLLTSAGTGAAPAWSTKITVSSSAPSSPSVNDLWVDTS